jgi:hypothetical protein
MTFVVGYSGRSSFFERALSATTHTLQPTEATMIGANWQGDVQGALAVGMRAIHFSSTDTHNGQLSILQTWHDFSPAACRRPKSWSLRSRFGFARYARPRLSQNVRRHVHASVSLCGGYHLARVRMVEDT